MVAGARNAAGGAVVLRGEPGIGKTALLEDAAAAATGLDVLRCHGFESEMALPWAALDRLVRPLAAHVDALPPVQRQALLVAAGVAAGPAPDRFLVALGVLGLLDEAARRRPLLCVVDDAHWLDEESLDALLLVARRLRAESVALLLAAREDPRLDARLAGVPTVRLSGLDVDGVRALLSVAGSRPVDRDRATWLAGATGGNPLALLDLGPDLPDLPDLPGLAGEPVPVGRRLEAEYVRRADLLGEAARTWLLLAAADATGDPDLLSRAASRLGLPADACDEAERVGLVTTSGTVTFRHPLVRAAVYGAAGGVRRRRVHAALRDAADALGQATLGAWHAAAATTGTDAAVADRLELLADAAAGRGGLPSRARVLARAGGLTPAGEVRDARFLAAAETAMAAGDAASAATLLARLGGPDGARPAPSHEGRALAVRASVALFTADRDGLVAAPATLLEAADHLHGHDPEREQLVLVRAFETALVCEHLMVGPGLTELGHRLARGAACRPGPASTVLEALAALVLAPYAEAAPRARTALDTLLALPDDALAAFGVVPVALATALWDERSRAAALTRLAARARDTGSLQQLDTSLWVLSLTEVNGGSPRRAGRYVEQVRELRRALGHDGENVVNVAQLAWSGAPREQVEALSTAVRDAGFGGVHSAAEGALAARDLAEGRYGDAYARLRPHAERPFLQGTWLRLPDLVEGAARSGRQRDAAPVVDRLAAMADASGSGWAVGVTERSRALLASGEESLDHAQRAVDALSARDVPMELARSHLVLGEGLRRARRLRRAREHLTTALDSFDRLGAPAFAARARAELEAAGRRTAARPARSPHGLTPREETVARLAARGRTNAEIGATLFLSPNTVDYHLRKVFSTLGVSSRRQLATRLDDLL